MPKSTLIYQGSVRASHACKLPIAPMGFSHVLRFVLAGRRCVHQQWHGDLLIVHHHRQHSFICACSRSKLPIAPMGKLLTCLLRLTLCTTGNASVNYRGCVPQRPSKVPIAPMGKLLTGLPRFSLAHLRLTLLLTTVGTCCRDLKLLHRPKVPIAPMGNALLTCPFRFSSLMTGAASIYQFGVRAICA